MRWDDSRSLRPDSFEVRARGIFARLEQTKTSGADKAVTVLPVFISLNAFIAEPEWLLTGLALWRSDGFAFERDYFLPLPRADLSGALR